MDATQTAVMGGKLGFPIRSCYPQVVLKDRAAYVLAIGDIVEPVEEWRAYKREITGREWDYVFRRLFYSYSPDLTTTPFSEPLEVAELDATAGHIWNLDLWVDDDGTAHLLYLTRSVQSAEMRDRFFPDTPLVSRLVYAQITDGAVTHSREILVAGEEGGTRLPHYGRFHVLPGGRLLVVYSAADVDENGQGYLANWVHDLSDPEMTDDVRLDLSEPFTTFFTAAPRGGSAPSDVLDVYGACPTANTLRYARIRVE